MFLNFSTSNFSRSKLQICLWAAFLFLLVPGLKFDAVGYQSRVSEDCRLSLNQLSYRPDQADPRDRVTYSIDFGARPSTHIGYRDLLFKEVDKDWSNASYRLPKLLRDVAGEFSQVCGPNCFNSALIFYGCEACFRESSVRDLLKDTDSRFRLLRKGELLQWGDLLIFEHPHISNVPAHAAIVIAGSWIFHKPNMNATTPWIFENLRDPNFFYKSMKVWRYRPRARFWKPNSD